MTISYLKDSLVLKQDGMVLAEKVGVYAYVECSALTLDGVKNVFKEVENCLIDEKN